MMYMHSICLFFGCYWILWAYYDNSNCYSLCFILLGQSLAVTIISNPAVPHFQAATALNLTCNVSGVFYPPLSYRWTSNCTGDCFVLERVASTISQMALRAIDSGAHTCSVVDAVGNVGMATFEMNVVGERKLVSKVVALYNLMH